MMVLGIVFFSSCQREVEEQLPNNNNSHSSEGSILEKYVTLDTTHPTGADTVQLTRFFYDPQTRILRVTDTWFQNGTHIISSAVEATYSYNGNDTVPFKVTYQTNANGIVFSDTLFLSYDNDDFVIRDSMVRYQSGVRRDMYCFYYTETSPWNYLVSGSAYDYTSNTPLHANRISLTRNWVNGNLVATYDSIYAQSIPGREDIVKTSFTFDNHPNPYVKTALHYPDYNFYSYDAYYSSLYTRNNPITYVTTVYSNQFPSAVTNQGEFRYTYNTLGYPVTITRYQNGNPSAPNFKTLLFYR